MNRRDFFELWFGESRELTLDELRSAVLKGEIREDKVRMVYWMLLFGILDLEKKKEWAKKLTEMREKYGVLLKKYEEEEKVEPSNVKEDNPLSQGEDTAWGRFFRRAEEKSLIRQDIDRCNQEYPIFQRKAVKEKMERILYLYTTEIAGIQYKQGMHDMLAPIIYIAEWECMRVDDAAEDDMFSMIYNSEYIEHNSFMIFEKLMEIVLPWYVQKDSSRGKAKVQNTLQGASAVGNLDDGMSDSVLHRRCNHIFYDILKERDQPLYFRLHELGMNPHVYLMRWVKVLFNREFHMEDLIIVWDAFFAVGDDFELVDYFTAAMLMMIREDALRADDDALLALLFKYPSVVNTNSLISFALKVRDWRGIMFEYVPAAKEVVAEAPQKTQSQRPRQGKNQPGKSQPSKSQPSKNQPSKSQPSKSQPSNIQPQLSSQFRDITLGFSNVFSSVRGRIDLATTQQAGSAGTRGTMREREYMEELTQLKIKYLKMASVIKRVVDVLTEELHNDVIPKSFDEDKVFMAMAELKMIKDVMTGQLDDVPDGPVYSSPLELPPSETEGEAKIQVQEQASSSGTGSADSDDGRSSGRSESGNKAVNPFDMLSETSMVSHSTETTTRKESSKEKMLENLGNVEQSVKNTSVRDLPEVNPFLD